VCEEKVVEVWRGGAGGGWKGGNRRRGEGREE